jgi:tetratricopeptide (TPR) repeat protein
VPIDRGDTLRNAEKLVRQGKLDQAIAEYLRVIEAQPRDWTTGNTLGDLYLKIGQVDKAIDQFIRLANGLSDAGFLPKAAALYKKVLKINPDHEHALLQAGEVAASQGVLVDARAYLNAVLERRRRRGDERGAAQITIRLAALDPGNLSARLAAARARVAIEDAETAVRGLEQIASELIAAGRQADGFDALREAAALKPDDASVREQLLRLYMAAGDYDGARKCAATSDQLKALAARLESSGRIEDALGVLDEAERLDPSDIELRAQIGRLHAAGGDFAAAAEYLTAETAAGDPLLQLRVAELQLRDGRIDEGMALARHVLEQNVNRRQDVALLGWTVAEQAPDVGYTLVSMAAGAAISQSDWATAAAGLQEFVTRVPNHLQALTRLLEICVEGGLEATMYSAQAQLADAYIAAGRAGDARALAQDLVAREPWDRANIERFRRVLVLMGERDPDAVIAERLSGQSPFTSTDLALDDEWPGAAAPGDHPFAGEPVASAAASPAAESNAPSAEIDFESLLADLESSAVTAHAQAHSRSESMEIDLSVALDDIQPRDDAARRAALERCEQDFRRGVTLLKAGDLEQATGALESASQAPRLRFATASILGRLHRERGAIDKAIEWFEQAAQAPAPTAEDGHQLLYELAEVLEACGETARALAICLELQADAGAYRDVSERVDRLAKVQARG